MFFLHCNSKFKSILSYTWALWAGCSAAGENYHFVFFSALLYCTVITHCFPFPFSISLSILPSSLPSFLSSLLLRCSYSLPPGCLLAAQEGWQMRGKKQETETSRKERMGCCLVLHLKTSHGMLWRFHSRAHIQRTVSNSDETALYAILDISQISTSFR